MNRVWHQAYKHKSVERTHDLRLYYLIQSINFTRPHIYDILPRYMCCTKLPTTFSHWCTKSMEHWQSPKELSLSACSLGAEHLKKNETWRKSRITEGLQLSVRTRCCVVCSNAWSLQHAKKWRRKSVYKRCQIPRWVLPRFFIQRRWNTNRKRVGRGRGRV